MHGKFELSKAVLGAQVINRRAREATIEALWESLFSAEKEIIKSLAAAIEGAKADVVGIPGLQSHQAFCVDGL